MLWALPQGDNFNIIVPRPADVKPQVKACRLHLDRVIRRPDYEKVQRALEDAYGGEHSVWTVSIPFEALPA